MTARKSDPGRPPHAGEPARRRAAKRTASKRKIEPAQREIAPATRNIHALPLSDMTDEELQAFFATCERAALAWLSPKVVPHRGIDYGAVADRWMFKAERARDELTRRLSIAGEKKGTLGAKDEAISTRVRRVAKREGPGRPPRAGKLATCRVEIRVTEDEHALLTSAARDENLATWAREVLLRSARKAK